MQTVTQISHQRADIPKNQARPISGCSTYNCSPCIHDMIILPSLLPDGSTSGPLRSQRFAKAPASIGAVDSDLPHITLAKTAWFQHQILHIQAMKKTKVQNRSSTPRHRLSVSVILPSSLLFRLFKASPKQLLLRPCDFCCVGST